MTPSLRDAARRDERHWSAESRTRCQHCGALLTGGAYCDDYCERGGRPTEHDWHHLARVMGAHVVLWLAAAVVVLAAVME